MARGNAGRIALLVVTLGVAATCVRLGFWQLDRLQQRRDLNSTISSRLALPPQPLTAVLEGSSSPSELAYRRVWVEGAYDTGREITLYGRPLEGRPGDHLLTPLILADDTAIIVDRGWVPTAPGRGAGETPPEGLVTVRGFLVEPESSTTASAEVPSTVAKLDLTLIGQDLPYEVAPVALRLQEQSPPQVSGLPAPDTPPELDEGPHLSYAVQWFSFAGVAIIGYLALERRERTRS
jgi:surfeit locus 1 family protein